MIIEGEVVSKRGKKVVKWGPGLAVQITREASKVSWEDKTFLRLIVIDDGNEKRIVLEKMGDV